MLKKRSAFFVLLAAFMLVAAACGDDEGGDVALGLVYDIGGRGDQSFNDSAAAGLDRAKADFGVTATELEPSEGGENREELLNLVSDEGAELVFGVGFLFADGISVAAQAHEDTVYGLIDGFIPNLNADCEGVGADADGNPCIDNVVALGFAEHEGSFLVGAAAALKSTTGKIGFIGGVEIDLIRKFQAGFEAGARHVDPDIEIDIKYISQPPDFSGFGDPAKGKEIALAQFQAGADVVYHAAGGSGAGLFEAAKEVRDGGGGTVWAIGVDSDQYLTAGADVQDVILTSMLKRVDTAVYTTIDEFVSGDFAGGYRAFGLADDGVGYSTSGGFVDDIADQLNDLRDQIIAGDITVPSAP